MYSSGSGHMTKMAVMPIYGKNPLKLFSKTLCFCLFFPYHNYIVGAQKNCINEMVLLSTQHFQS